MLEARDRVQEQEVCEEKNCARGALPRLLYVGDVGVVETMAGELFLHRLLRDYPPSQLRIVETSLARRAEPSLRLPTVVYDRLPIPGRRGLSTRFARYFGAYYAQTATSRARRLDDVAREFRPEAVLTVAHGFSWLTAATLAERSAVPLHLVIHDHVLDTMSLPRWRRPACERQFAAVYRQAATRLCISPLMAEHYERAYGLPADVLYPLRGRDSVEFETPAPRIDRDLSALTVAYFGSFDSPGSSERLATLAEVLGRVGGQLLVYTDLVAEQARAIGLLHSHVSLRPRLPTVRELLDDVRREADVLFLPMSFAEQLRANVELSFPSKLADYTAAGLPLLVWAPGYSSAVRWVVDNPGVAEVVDRDDREQLEQSLTRLVQDRSYRRRLAAAALVKGRESFSHAVVASIFEAHLSERQGPAA